MSKVQNQIPEYKVYLYKYDSVLKFYQLKSRPLDNSKLPPKLRIEVNQKKGNVKTKYLARAKWEKWSKTILTGLGETECPGIYFGDQFIKRKKNFLVFRFYNGNDDLIIYYFNSFYPLNPTLRERIIDDLLSQIKKGNQNDFPLRFKNQITDKAT